MKQAWPVFAVMGMALVLLATPEGQQWWAVNKQAYQLFIFVLLAVTLWLRRDWLRDNAPVFAAYGRGFTDLNCGRMFLLGLALLAAGFVWMLGGLGLRAPVALILIPFIILSSVGFLLVMLSLLVKLAKMLMR